MFEILLSITDLYVNMLEKTGLRLYLSLALLIQLSLHVMDQ